MLKTSKQSSPVHREFQVSQVAPETCSLTSPPTPPTDVYQIVPSARDQLHNGNNTPQMLSNDLDRGASEQGLGTHYINEYACDSEREVGNNSRNILAILKWNLKKDHTILLGITQGLGRTMKFLI